MSASAEHLNRTRDRSPRPRPMPSQLPPCTHPSHTNTATDPRLQLSHTRTHLTFLTPLVRGCDWLRLRIMLHAAWDGTQDMLWAPHRCCTHALVGHVLVAYPIMRGLPKLPGHAHPALVHLASPQSHLRAVARVHPTSCLSTWLGLWYAEEAPTFTH